jgi:ABC-type glycerol-3-phosphate transport system substrate-binding protein
MNKKLLVFSLLALLSVTLTACSIKDLPFLGQFFGGAKKVTKKPVTLNVWGMWENPDVAKTLIDKYKVLHPNVTINYDDRSVLSPDDYKERVYARITQTDAPDIIAVHNSWVPGLKTALSTMPTDLLTAQDYSTKFYPSATQMAVLDGNIYATPLYYDGLVLVYNKKHFDQIDQMEAPTAWEELRRIATELAAKDASGKLIRGGVALGTADNIDFFSDILGLMFAQAGVDIPSKLDTKGAWDALSFYTNFVKEDKVWDNTFPEASTAFAQDKVSMIFVPTWNLLDILKARPDMEIGVAPVPQALPDRPTAWSTFWTMVVPKTSKNSYVAWDFLNFLTQEEQQLVLFSKASEYRQYGAPYSLVSLSSQISTNLYLKPVLVSAPFAKTAEIGGRVGNKKQVTALKEAVNSLFGEFPETAENAMKKAKEAIIK